MSIFIDRTGEIGYNNQGEKMTIITYRNNADIDVQFEDKVVVKHKGYSSFKKGTIKHPVRYEESFAYYLEVELGFNLDKIWNWEKNNELGINPYKITKRSNKKVWLYCMKKDYHNDYGGYDITCSHFYEGNRCSYCRKQQKLHPKDSLAYNYPDIAKMIAIEENNLTFDDCYKITCHSNRKFYFKCPDCGIISDGKKLIGNIVKRGYSCHICGDRINIPEKFMINILNQLNIEFILHLSKINFDWCGYYEYDFYLPKFNIIIETHGCQHYIQPGGNWGNLENIQMNDLFKRKCAESHVDNYIVIDCRYSTLEWLKENTIKELSSYFDLSKIDWELAWEESQNSKCFKSWILWNEGLHDIVKISEILMINRITTLKFLKRGAESGKCDYSIYESKKRGYDKIKGNNHWKSHKVYCLTINKEFNSIAEAEKYFNMKRSNISRCCKGECNYSGKLEDGTPLKWMYYEDYIEEYGGKNE